MRPPRLARWLLTRALPADTRRDVDDFLSEEFAGRAERGAMGARAWYWTQALSFSVRFATERARDLRNAVSHSDVKLAMRMLVRYPGLTVVSALGIAVGIAIAAGTMSVLHTMSDPQLPFHEGDRIVAIQNHDKERNQTARRSVHDFADWKSSVKSVTEIGAYRRVERNLIEPGRTPETLRVAEMSASGFRVTGIAPIMGRTLEDSDERAGAPAVVVIGETFWRDQLQSTPNVLGRPLQLGDTTYTIVGVMPAGYEFPVRDSLWIPWRVDPLKFARGQGPGASVFGRLAPGVSIEAARAELAAIGARTAAAFPETHKHLDPQVIRYTHPFTDMDDPDNALFIHVIRVLVVMLVGIACVNVAILVYARTARRQGEIAIRTALGAGRARIIAQLFVEALALAGCAAVVGLVLASIGLRQLDQNMDTMAGTQMAFWLRFGLTPRMAVYTAGLTLMAAVIVGVVPALKATGRRVQSGLKTISAGGGAGMQLGRVWTSLIVAQVAFAVAVLPAALYTAWDTAKKALVQPDQSAREFVTADLSIDRSMLGESSDPAAARELDRLFAVRHTELLRRLKEEPRVSDVTFSLTRPGTEGMMFIELEGVAAPVKRGDYSLDEGSAMGHLSRFTRIDPGYFETYDVPQLAGRRLDATDTAPSSTTVVVSKTFADRYFAGEALGRRLRYVGRGGDADPGYVALGTWYEIVGIVADFPAASTNETSANVRIYHAAAPGTLSPSVLSIRIPGGAPPDFAERLRTLAGAVDPNLQVRGVRTLAQSLTAEKGLWRLIATSIGAVALALVSLCAAGIYAMMSFTVAQRRREIGIRSALGADARQILRGIFARAAVQLTAGATVGMGLALLLEQASGGDMVGGQRAVVLPIVAAFMTLVGLAATYGPARQGLRIQPTEALRSE